MNNWLHKIKLDPAAGSSPEDVAQLIAARLEALPASFRALLDSCGDSLDDFARYLREDAARGCSLDDVDAWLDKLFDWGDAHRLWIEVAWTSRTHHWCTMSTGPAT